MEIKSLGELVEKEIQIRSLDELYKSGEITDKFYSRLKEFEESLKKKRGYERVVNLESYLLQEHQFYETTVKDLCEELGVTVVYLSILMKKMNIPTRNPRETSRLPSQRKKFSEAKKGKYNPMYQVRGKNHPSYGKKASIQERINHSLSRLPKGIVLPTKDELYNLRIKRRMTKENIGKLYKVSDKCIDTWMDIYKISDVLLPRGPPKSDIPKEELERLAKILPVSQIASQFNVTVTTIYRRLDEESIQGMSTAEAQRLSRQMNRQRA